MSLRHYILDEAGNPVVEPDRLKWALFFEQIERRRVAWDGVQAGRIVSPQQAFDAQDDTSVVFVSTVFLGFDVGASFNPAPEDQPLLWETLVQGGYFAGLQYRYPSRDKAAAGHGRIVQSVAMSMQMAAMLKLGVGYFLGDGPLQTLAGMQAFEAWAADHLRSMPHFFSDHGLIGFRRKQDAAIFMLSQWFEDMHDITDPAFAPIAEPG